MRCGVAVAAAAAVIPVGPEGILFSLVCVHLLRFPVKLAASDSYNSIFYTHIHTHTQQRRRRFFSLQNNNNKKKSNISALIIRILDNSIHNGK